MDDHEAVLVRYFASRGRLFKNAYDVPDWLRRQLIKGYAVELEHGSKIDPRLNVSHDKVDTTIKIALAHLTEAPDYYDRLEVLEQQADAYWKEHSGDYEEKKKHIESLLN